MAIYLARNQGYYKIGYSNDPYKRLAELQVGNPSSIEMVGTISGSMEDERRFHALFKEKRVRGEWFALSDEDVRSFLSSSSNLLPSPVKPPKPLKQPPAKTRITDPVPAFVRRPQARARYEGMAPDGGDLYLSSREADDLVKFLKNLKEEHEHFTREYERKLGLIRHG